VRGDPSALGAPAIAIVGARAATRAARTHTRRLARALAARGLTIVSGLARGIDAEAHRGALEAGGVSVGVLACGIDQTYPPEHRALASEVADSGAVVSEMPLGTSPRRELFPLRNRIISGLCQGVIVSEARARSGSLITVRHALEQGREVFVLPGAIEGPFAVGSNRLLRDGARAILSVDDVLEDLGLSATGSSDPRPPTEGAEAVEPRSRDALEGEILRALADEPLSLDALTERVDADPARLAERLIDLELDGRVGIERDGRFHRGG
jgi:DNA processing protein